MIATAIGVGVSPVFGGRAAASPFAGYALALAFSKQQYRSGSAYKTDVTQLPGYAYSGSDASQELNASGGLVSFAPNVPRITDLGFYARAAVTNLVLHSQDVTGAGGNTLAGVFPTANTVLAPDGTMTADTVTETADFGAHWFSYTASNQTLAAGTQYTMSACLKAGTMTLVQLTGSGAAFGTAQYANFDLVNGIIGNTAGGTASMKALPDGWYRCSWTTAANGSTGSPLVISGIPTLTTIRVQPYAGSGRTLHVWQAQCVAGTDPGPVIVTAGAAATVGAAALTVGAPNGAYNAVYTFDDGSTQTIVTAIGGGVFNHPVFPTVLNRPLVRQVLFEAA